MRNQSIVACIVTCASLLLAVGCGSKTGEANKAQPGGSAATGKLTVATVNYPVFYFAKRIAGDDVNLIFPAPAGEDPAFWEPSEADLKQYRDAPLILDNGATYAKWMTHASLDALKVVNTSKGFEKDFLKLEHAVTHSHGPGGEHTHEGTDFNTWMDPAQARQQAQAVCEALTKLLPEKKADFAKRLGELESDLDGLGKGFEALAPAMQAQPLLASHPVYNYLAKRHGWKLKSLLWEPETMPSAEDWKSFADLHQAHPAKIMLYEDTPSPEIAAKLKADFGIETVVFRTCGNRPESGDYLSEMKANLERLKAAFGSP